MSRTGHGFDALLLGLLAISLVVNVLLAIRVHSRADRRTTGAPDTTWVPPRIPAGTKVPLLRVRDADGKAVTIDYAEDARPTVIYVLDPMCGWCSRNAANVAALASQARPRFRFVGVAARQSGLTDFLRRHPTPFPVYSQPDEQAYSVFQMGGVPRTVVVSTTGEVLADFPGAYLPHLQQEVETYFAVRLPGLPRREDTRTSDASRRAATAPPRGTTCIDQLGQEFSPGWIDERDGTRRICGEDGRWRPLN